MTVSVEDDLYRKTRVAAAEADTTVTALVREFLNLNGHRHLLHVKAAVADGNAYFVERRDALLAQADEQLKVTAVQIFEEAGVLPAELKAGILAWMHPYLDWLLASKLGKEADALPQNHADWYTYQVVGLMIYLGRADPRRALQMIKWRGHAPGSRAD